MRRDPATLTPLRVAAKYGKWYYTKEEPNEDVDGVLYTLYSADGIAISEFGTLYHMTWYVRNGGQRND